MYRFHQTILDLVKINVNRVIELMGTIYRFRLILTESNYMV